MLSLKAEPLHSVLRRHRVGIVGNSHLGSLKLALSADPGRYPSLDVSFWGMPGSRMNELLRVGNDGSLSAAGGPNKALAKVAGDANATFDPKAFDVIAIYAYSMGMNEYFRTYAALADNDEITARLRDDAFAEELMRRFAFRYAKLISGLGRKVAIFAAPYSSERSIRERFGQAERHIPAAIEFAKKMAASVGASFHTQPAKTVTAGYFTAAGFALADNRHTNASFGALVLDEMTSIARR